MSVRPTYKKIASACGVNSSTVSRALNNHRSIPEATRKRIRSIAERMGWQPNPLASAYMAHLRSTHPPSFKASLAVVVDFPMPGGIDDLPGHVRRIYQGTERRAAEYGYRVHPFCLCEPDMTPARLDRTLFNRNIPGMIITGMSTPGKRLDPINWSRYAVVATGYSLLTPRLHRVANNVMHGFKLVIDKAFSMGYRRVGVAVSRSYDERTNHGVLFPASYIRTQLRPGQALETFIYDDHGPDAVPIVAEWLERVRPELAIGTYMLEAIQSLGWRIPEDIAFATFDVSQEYPDHAGLDQRHETIGRVAADVLINEITHNHRGIPRDPVEHTILGHWVDGQTAPSRRLPRRRAGGRS